MLPITHTCCASTGELLDKALDTAEFYGFSPLETVLKQHKKARQTKSSTSLNFAHPAERKFMTLTKSFVSHGLNHVEQPVFTYHTESAGRVGTKPASVLGLHAIGSYDAIAEGVLIATLATLLRDAGAEEFAIHINSLGDKESSARFMRELNTYLRNHINDLPGYARDELQGGNLVRAFTRLAEKEHEVVSGAPNPVEFLNDESRMHLRNVLEYVENINVPYELNPNVLGSGDCWQHTLFEIRIPENGHDVTVARGGRYNPIAQKGFRMELPAVGALLDHEVRGRVKPKRRNKKHIKFFFAQLGPLARLQSFGILEDLRTAGVPVAQAIAIESIGDQLRFAERYAVPYTVIIGHKEALEGTAIVRNMKNRSQTVVPTAHLSGYLKRLRVD